MCGADFHFGGLRADFENGGTSIVISRSLRPIISRDFEVEFGVCGVGFISFVHNPTPILPKMVALEIMFALS